MIWIAVHRVVIVGGDGLYMEVMHGVVLRKQQENGIDYNNPDASLTPPNIGFGIIPGGVWAPEAIPDLYGVFLIWI